ncbi:MAG: hypothetical protein IKP58_02060 [Victivallales bacterium]|nr:hypothetical protein [Victivallales bacterium]
MKYDSRIYTYCFIFSKLHNVIISLLFIFHFALLGNEPWNFDEIQQQGCQSMLNAMETTNKASYFTILKSPFPTWKYIREAHVYRLFDTHTLSSRIRLECFGPDNKLFAIFIKNKDGQFVYLTLIDKWIAGGDFNCLFKTEIIANPFYVNEMKFNNYESADAKYRGIPCKKIICRLNVKDDDTLRLRGQTGCIIEDETFSNENKGKIKKWDTTAQFSIYHPYVRIFIIGKDDDIIYDRRHFNKDGNLLYSSNLGDVQLNSPKLHAPGLFDTPKEIYCYIESMRKLQDYIQNEMKIHTLTTPKK